MVELKFSKDKPTLLLMKGRKKLGIFYIEDNWIHKFADDVAENICNELCESKDEVDAIVSKYSGIEFGNIQIIYISKKA